MNRLLILSSAALVISGCTQLNGTDSYFSHNQQMQQSSSYASNGCYASNCASGSTYPVTNAAAHHAPQHFGSHGTQPSAHAYGTQVQGHPAYAGGQHGAYGAPRLRGRHNARQGYKYGTLGAVMYDTGADMYGIQGRLGYQSAKIFGAEVEGSFGLTSDEETVGTITTNLDTNYQVGAFGVARAPLTDRFSVHSRVGYHATKLSSEIDDGAIIVENSDTFDGLAYGVGGEYSLNPRDSIRLDYTRYDLGTTDSDSWAVSYARKF